MAWSPIGSAYTIGQVLTAAHMNAHRNQLAETAPAKATAPGQLFYATGPNAISALTPPGAASVLRGGPVVPSWAGLMLSPAPAVTEGARDDEVMTWGAVRGRFLAKPSADATLPTGVTEGSPSLGYLRYENSGTFTLTWPWVASTALVVVRGGQGGGGGGGGAAGNTPGTPDAGGWGGGAGATGGASSVTLVGSVPALAVSSAGGSGGAGGGGAGADQNTGSGHIGRPGGDGTAGNAGGLGGRTFRSGTISSPGSPGGPRDVGIGAAGGTRGVPDPGEAWREVAGFYLIGGGHGGHGLLAEVVMSPDPGESPAVPSLTPLVAGTSVLTVVVGAGGNGGNGGANGAGWGNPIDGTTGGRGGNGTGGGAGEVLILPLY